MHLLYQISAYMHIHAFKLYLYCVKYLYVITYLINLCNFPVAQLVEHGASNAKIMGSIPRESKS